MYNILKEINNSTYLCENNNQVYIAKVIALEDMPLYKKLMSFNNANIVKFYDTEVIDNKFCVIEEYVQGQTLENYVKENGCLNDEKTTQIVTGIINGLAEIHANGLVHRDITPSNIMLTNDGIVKIIDFGITRKSKQNQPQDTQILGTQGFAAPEQFGFTQTNQKADIYAVGVLINYLKTGKMPNEQMASGFYRTIIEKCTQIDEVNRYSTVNELLDAVLGKGKKKFTFEAIPGFRQDIWWHKLIACIYYIIAIFGFLLLFFDNSGVPFVLPYPFFFFIPVPILTNYKDWTSKLSFIKYKSKSAKASIKFVFTVISWIIGSIIIIIVK